MEVLGIDIGGSGIKGALVDTDKGELISKRYRIPTPQPSTPAAVIDTVNQVVRHFDYQGPIGVGMPSVVIDGVVMTAANIDEGWIGYPGKSAIAEATGCNVILMNDADMAGLAEMSFGAGRGEKGTVMIFTLGTGIGSSMFIDGRIVPNLELGHLYLPGRKKDAEYQTADRIRQEKKLSWKRWGKRLNVYFNHVEYLFSPHLIIIGGGVSKQYEKFLPYIQVRARVIPAMLRNEAGIVGAGMAAMRGIEQA
jgi:polyphosphate glucokinase